MPLDKQLVQEAMAQYKAWNEADFVNKVLQAGSRSHQEKWHDFCSLYAFGKRIKPQISRGEQLLWAEEWNSYFESIRRFEAWRCSRG